LLWFAWYSAREIQAATWDLSDTEVAGAVVLAYGWEPHDYRSGAVKSYDEFVKYRYTDQNGKIQTGECKTGTTTDSPSASSLHSKEIAKLSQLQLKGKEPEVESVKIRFKRSRPEESCLEDRVPPSRAPQYVLVGIVGIFGLGVLGYGFSSIFRAE
jgi:hypothetical protein